MSSSLLATMTAELNQEAQKVWQEWSKRYLAQIQQVSIDQAINDMQANNPVYILRNSMAQRAITPQNKVNLKKSIEYSIYLPILITSKTIATELDSTPPAPHAPQMPISCSS